MVLSYITNMISFHQPPQYDACGDDIDDELTLPIQMPASMASATASTTASKHHIISIIDFMRHSRHIQEHRAPNTSKL